VVHETSDEVQLEGQTRLAPGQLVELVFTHARSEPSLRRHALVLSWAVATLGKEGPIYRGVCRWRETRELNSRVSPVDFLGR
jgi:hypothetical protein